jgi:hypothetical protein
MGHPLILQALPEESRLYARLRDDRRVATLFAQLFNAGGGPYSWATLSDLDEHLDGIAKHVEAFASRADVDRAMADLLTGLEQARAAHPGLEGRRVFLDKTQWDIEERLNEELRRRGHSEMEPFVSAILFGAATLTPPGVEGPMGDGLRLVPPATVREAARILDPISPESLFDPETKDYLCEDYRDFRGLYLTAAEQGEAIVVGD